MTTRAITAHPNNAAGSRRICVQRPGSKEDLWRPLDATICDAEIDLSISPFSPVEEELSWLSAFILGSPETT
jgi:hypothetical protein